MIHIRHLTVICLVAFWVGCKGPYYIPNNHNVPLLEQKGDLSANAATRISITRPSIDFQLGYALTDKLGVMYNFNHQSFAPLFINRSTSQYSELGLGTFSKSKSQWIREIYGVVGIGKVKTDIGFEQVDILKYTKYGLQANIGTKASNLHASFSSRLMRLSYFDKEVKLEGNRPLSSVNVGSSYILLEPAFLIGYQGKDMNVLMNYGRSFNLTDSNFHQVRSRLTFSIGLNLNVLSRD